MPSRDETLSFGIVVGIAGPAHADGDVVTGEALAIFGRGEANVSDVGHPDLIQPGRHQATQQIRHDEKAVTVVRGGWCERFAAHGDEVIPAHKPLNPLGIYNHAGASEHGRDAPVAIESVAQAEQLDMAGQLYIGFTRGTGLEAAIITCPGNAGELAEMLNVNFADVRCSRDFDDLRETGAIELCRSAASKARKAL
jgi:hypothetical protein